MKILVEQFFRNGNVYEMRMKVVSGGDYPTILIFGEDRPFLSHDSEEGFKRIGLMIDSIYERLNVFRGERKKKEDEDKESYEKMYSEVVCLI